MPPVIKGAEFPASAFEEEVIASSFLWRRMFLLSSPAAIQHVLVNNAGNYMRPAAARRGLEPVLGDGLFLAEGEEWRRQRKLVQPFLNARTLPSVVECVARNTSALLRDLRSQAPQTVSLLHVFRDLTNRISADLFFKVDITPYEDDVRRLSHEFMLKLSQGNIFDFLLPSSAPGPIDFARRRFQRRWLALFTRIVDDVRKSDGFTDLFNAMDKSEVTRRALVQQFATIFVTGSQTTGVSLYWSAFLAASRPELQLAIAEEARAAGVGETATLEALDKLSVSRALVNESLRLYPPGISIVREALADDVADGQAIPKGAFVQIAPWVVHRHRRLWDNADEFDIGRFAPGTKLPRKFMYIPFGAGERQCVGMHIALAEATTVLAMLFRNFILTPTSQKAPDLVAQVTLQPVDPTPFRLEARPH